MRNAVRKPNAPEVRPYLPVVFFDTLGKIQIPISHRYFYTAQISLANLNHDISEPLAK